MGKTSNSNKNAKALWDGIGEDAFASDNNIVDRDVGDFNLENMKIFSFNLNVFRQIIRLSDSLKPVERRLLYSMYLSNARPTLKPHPCNGIVGDANSWHPHSDSPIYKSLIGMAQPWKKSVPLIDVSGEIGNDAFSEMYASSRYTKACISKYAWECFFDDFDDDCVEKILNTANDKYEPMSFPSKFPNILVNGGMGIAVGNQFRIPPYNATDIISLCKRLIDNPDHANIYMIPDLPTGCDVVDDGRNLREICETGSGVLKMRSTIDILEGVYDKKPVWILQIKNVPWMTSLTSIDEKITELTKKGLLPIKETQPKSYPVYTGKNEDETRMIIDYRIIIDKSLDPNKIKQKLYTMTELEKSVAVNFKVVMDGLTVEKLNMRDLILSWLDERRAYKRRLLNKKIVKLSSRISLLEILIYLLDKDNIEKTMTIIKNNDYDEIVNALKMHGNMSSYQATKIAEMKLSAFTKDARDKYIAEKDKLEIELKYTLDLIKSEKKIDKLIIEELDDLKKYSRQRLSHVVSADSNIEISNSDHTVIITKQGMIKKLLYSQPTTAKAPGLGAFKNMDYPIQRLIINNLDSIMMFDSLGKYSCIPVYTIDNTEASSVGNNIYDYTKLDGTIVSAFQYMNKDTEEYVKNKLNKNLNVVLLTKNGYIKKLSIDDFTNMKSQKNIRALKLKDNDTLVYANIIMDGTNLIIYTKKGNYVSIVTDDISIQGKETIGSRIIELTEDDECVGLNVIGMDDEVLIVVTDKGSVKKCELKYFLTDMKKKQSSYFATIEPNDNVIYVNGAKEKNKIFVCTRSAYQMLPIEDLPVLSRKAKCQKLIAVPQGNNIISVEIQ